MLIREIGTTVVREIWVLMYVSSFDPLSTLSHLSPFSFCCLLVTEKWRNLAILWSMIVNSLTKTQTANTVLVTMWRAANSVNLKEKKKKWTKLFSLKKVCYTFARFFRDYKNGNSSEQGKNVIGCDIYIFSFSWQTPLTSGDTMNIFFWQITDAY